MLQVHLDKTSLNMGLLTQRDVVFLYDLETTFTGKM